MIEIGFHRNRNYAHPTFISGLVGVNLERQFFPFDTLNFSRDTPRCSSLLLNSHQAHQPIGWAGTFDYWRHHFEFDWILSNFKRLKKHFAIVGLVQLHLETINYQFYLICIILSIIRAIKSFKNRKLFLAINH